MDARYDTIYRLAWPVAALVVALLLVGSTGCYEVVEPVCGSLPADELSSFRIESDGGPVRVQRLAGATEVVLDGEIHIAATTRGGADDRVERIHLDFFAEGDVAVVELEIPLSAQPAWGELLLTVPDGFGGSIHTLNGEVTAEGLDGDLRVDTTNGEVTVSGVLGEVDVHSTNGAVTVGGGAGDTIVDTTNSRIEVSGRDGEVDLHTTNGRIEVRALTGEVRAETTNGKILVEEHSGDLDVATTNGAIELDTEPLPGGSVQASTTNGAIDLELPRDVSAVLHAETTNGDIEIEDLSYDGQVHDDWADVVLGSGDGDIELATTNGAIDVRAR